MRRPPEGLSDQERAEWRQCEAEHAADLADAEAHERMIENGYDVGEDGITYRRW